ncbi:MAG: hypothetical protein ACRDVP_05945, partial [Acidimicrobiales bacterium]
PAPPAFAAFEFNIMLPYIGSVRTSTPDPTRTDPYLLRHVGPPQPPGREPQGDPAWSRSSLFPLTTDFPHVRRGFCAPHH